MKKKLKKDYKSLEIKDILLVSALQVRREDAVKLAHRLGKLMVYAPVEVDDLVGVVNSISYKELEGLMKHVTRPNINSQLDSKQPDKN